MLHSRDENGARTVRACDGCHASKTRCSGQKPCAACSRRRVECTFERDGPEKRPPSDKGSEMSRAEIEDILVQHENCLRQGLLKDGTSETRDGNTDLDIDHYVHIYFTHFHYQWPIIHCRSFRPSDESQILRLTLAMLGLWTTGEKTARDRATSMHEKLIALLETRMDDWMECDLTQSWPLTTHQTVVLNVVFAIVRDVPKTIYERCRKLLEAVTRTCIRGGLFNYERILAQGQATDSMLFKWTYIEEMKRFCLAVFKLNCLFGTGLLRLADLRFPLPDPGYLWDAPDTSEFYRRYHAQLESGTMSNELICDIVRDVHQGKRGRGVLFQADIWLGLLS
ncbi:hypothetical protein BDV18DRAFT_148082 [Aspergillus unguis]